MFSTYAQDKGLDLETCLNLAEILSGGVAHSGNVCGAVTGALMAISLQHGKARQSKSFTKNAPSAHDLGKQFMDRFKQRNGTLLCRELIGHDMYTKKNLQIAQEEKAFTNCPKFVRGAAEILEDIL